MNKITNNIFSATFKTKMSEIMQSLTSVNKIFFGLLAKTDIFWTILNNTPFIRNYIMGALYKGMYFSIIIFK